MQVVYTRTYSCSPTHNSLQVLLITFCGLLTELQTLWFLYGPGKYLSFFTRTWLQLPGAAHRSTALVTPTETTSVTLQQAQRQCVDKLAHHFDLHVTSEQPLHSHAHMKHNLPISLKNSHVNYCTQRSQN
jgi:hypothetical protein